MMSSPLLAMRVIPIAPVSGDGADLLLCSLTCRLVSSCRLPPSPSGQLLPSSRRSPAPSPHVPTVPVFPSSYAPSLLPWPARRTAERLRQPVVLPAPAAATHVRPAWWVPRWSARWVQASPAPNGSVRCAPSRWNERSRRTAASRWTASRRVRRTGGAVYAWRWSRAEDQPGSAEDAGYPWAVRATG